jgi:hypothetical protein
MNRQWKMQIGSESWFHCGADRHSHLIDESSRRSLARYPGEICIALEQKDNRQQDMYDPIAR